MKFLPDTNALSRHLRGLDPDLSARLHDAVAKNELVFSFVVYAELRFGAEKAQLAGNRRPADRVARLRQSLVVEPLTQEVAEAYARLRAFLEKRGTPIGPMDLLLASHAVILGATLVTHNTREFSRIPGLKVEDWQSAG